MVLLRLKALTATNPSYMLTPCGYGDSHVLQKVEGKQIMAGGDSGITNFKVPETPTLGLGARSGFDASTFQAGASPRAYSVPLDSESLTFTPIDTGAPVGIRSAIASPDVSSAPTVLASTEAPGTAFQPAGDIPPSTAPLDAALPATAAVDNKLEAGQSPNVTVQYSDQAPDAKLAGIAPTVVIDKSGNLLGADGKPFDSNSLDFTNTGAPKNIVIQLQHDANDPVTGTDAQKQALNGFLQDQLNPALRQQIEAASEQGVQVKDMTGEVKQDVAQNLARIQPPEAPAPLAPQTSQAVNNINSDMPSDDQQHSMPSRQARQYFSHADVPQGQDADTTATKDMIAALDADKEHPYETVRQRSDNSYAVGRYGSSFNNFNNYMMMALTPEMLALLGNPPDYSKLGKLLKEHPEMLKKLQENMHKLVQEGKVPKGFEDRVKTADAAEHFGNFIDKLHGTKGALTADEIKQNAPKEMQEAMATDLVKHGNDVKAAPDRIALANELGKQPENLTANDLKDPKNKEVMQAAFKYYALAQGKQHATGSDNIDYQVSSDPNVSEIRMKIAQSAGSHVLGGDGYRGGKCAWSVQLDADQAGLHSVVGTGNAWDMGQNLLRQGSNGHKNWAQINPQDAGPGDLIFFHDPNYLGDVQTIKSRNGNTYTSANDKWYRNQDINGLGNVPHRRNAYSNYDRSIVLRYVGDQPQQQYASNKPKTSDEG